MVEGDQEGGSQRNGFFLVLCIICNINKQTHSNFNLFNVELHIGMKSYIRLIHTTDRMQNTIIVYKAIILKINKIKCRCRRTWQPTSDYDYDDRNSTT